MTAVLLELTKLAKPVERPCLCCNTHHDSVIDTVQVCVAFLARVHAVFLLKVTEQANPVEMLWLCCNM